MPDGVRERSLKRHHCRARLEPVIAKPPVGGAVLRGAEYLRDAPTISPRTRQRARVTGERKLQPRNARFRMRLTMGANDLFSGRRVCAGADLQHGRADLRDAMQAAPFDGPRENLGKPVMLGGTPEVVEDFS